MGMTDDAVIAREVRSRVPEHQILLSFTDDVDAEVFYEWWTMYGGRTAFREYYQGNSSEVRRILAHHGR